MKKSKILREDYQSYLQIFLYKEIKILNLLSKSQLLK